MKFSPMFLSGPALLAYITSVNAAPLGNTTGTVGPTGVIKNNCDRYIYAKVARGDGYDGETCELKKGESWTIPVAVLPDDIRGGISMKVQWTNDTTWSDIYQIEYSYRTGYVHYDISALDDKPGSFANISRHLEVVGSGCPVLHMNPQNTSLEWPVQRACRVGPGSKILFTIC